MRALIAARKSTKVDGADGLGLHTQDERARAFISRLGWEVAAAARDTISGRVAPVDRKELGAWLTDPERLRLYDCIVAYKADRLSRGEAQDWSRIEAWAADNSKTLIIVDSGDGVRFPPRGDSDYWQWSAIKRQAGAEWEDIRERIIRSNCRILRDGFWAGKPPFGYVIEGPRYRKSLAVDPVAGAAVARIFELVIDGWSLRKVMTWLEEAGVPSVAGNAVWNKTQVRAVVVNHTYSGTHSRHCQDCDARHVIEVPAIVDPATQARAEAALASRVRSNYRGGGRPTSDPAMLVPTCGVCGLKMYRGGSGRYYRCAPRTVAGRRQGCGLTVDLSVADGVADEWLSLLQAPETTAAVVYPAAELESRIELARRAQNAAYEADDMPEMLRRRAAVLDLTNQLATTERTLTERKPTGRTLGKAWQDCPRAGRRDWLKAQGIEVRLTGDRFAPVEIVFAR